MYTTSLLQAVFEVTPIFIALQVSHFQARSGLELLQRGGIQLHDNLIDLLEFVQSRIEIAIDQLDHQALPAPPNSVAAYLDMMNPRISEGLGQNIH